MMRIHPLPSRSSMLAILLVSAGLLLTPLQVRAWDATGHRISAYLAWDRLTESRRNVLIALIESHPRFRQDFLGEMPASVQQDSLSARQRWLFGQAAVWPDLARGLPEAIRDEYNRPDWHWIDGALLYGEAQEQGNVYIAVPARPDINGDASTDTDNVLMKLRHSLAELRSRSPGVTTADRAVALSWFLHLAADLHQPLHTGALFAPGPLRDGDRGGNLIRVAQGHEGENLHALWDRALRSPDPEGQFRRLLRRRDAMMDTFDTDGAPTRWLAESRALLHAHVYPPALRNAIQQRAARDRGIPVFDPSAGYLTDMQRISREQVIRSAERIARVLAELELPQ